MSLLLLFLIVFYVGEYWLIKQDVKRLVLIEDKIKRDYSIPSSNIRLNSIIKSLEKKRKDSIASREYLQFLLKIPLKDGDFLRQVKSDKKLFTIKIKLSQKENAPIYKAYLSENSAIRLRALEVKDLIMTIKGERQ